MTERKREKFAGNASTEIWERERKVEEMLLNWGKEKRRNELYIYGMKHYSSVYPERCGT